jgi:hypothetical protein
VSQQDPPHDAEGALAEVQKLAASDDEDHEERLRALERLHRELEGKLDERDTGSRPEE